MKHHYMVNVLWTGNEGNGTTDYSSYKRDHIVSVEGKARIPCSSDPKFRGDKTKMNPEELFVASLSSCHMLWYLHLCAESGIIVTDYEDNASGVMVEGKDIEGHFSSVTLHPIVTVTEERMIKKALELHAGANEKCFIANSCNFPVWHKPECKVLEK